MTEPAQGDVIEATVERLGARGDGLARTNGVPLYVPLAAPGERVRARIGARKGEGFAAEIVEILSPGPARVSAPCPHFGPCGGCTVQHVADGAYADWKRGLVVQALARRGLGDVAVEPPVRVGPHSRRRASLKAVRGRDGGLALGFHARASRRVVDVASCLLLEPALESLLAPLWGLLDSTLGPGGRAAVELARADTGLDVVLATRGPPDLALRERLAAFAAEHDLARLSWRPLAGGAPEPVAQRRPVRVAFADVPVDLPPGAFLQPSAAGEAALIETVGKACARARAVADLYAGCGTLSLPLAAGRRVHAVEGNPDMAAALDAAAARAGLSGRLKVETRDLARRPLAGSELAPFEAVVFDPPRAGARVQAAALADSRVPAVVALSCNPATFARDARILVDGGFRPVRVRPLDQFPWSAHVEVMAEFRR